MNGAKIRSLVTTWLTIDFFADSRKHGDVGSSLTSTIFTQAFMSLAFAAVFLPEVARETALAWLSANLTLSTGLIGIGVLADPQRSRRAQADELLLQTAPVSALEATLARLAHGAFYMVLISVGMAIPPAILSYWVCGASLQAVALYLVMASLLAGLMAGCLALFTRAVRLGFGEGRAQLFAGTLKALLLGGGLCGFALCIPHLDGRAHELPFGELAVESWPPFWAAQVILQPAAAWPYLLRLVLSAAALFGIGVLLQGLRPRRVQGRGGRGGLLAGVERRIAGEGALFGVAQFVGLMLYRSPGFRARVLPLFGMPAAMGLLSFWDQQEGVGQTLLMGTVLQFPAVFLPFLVAFLHRSDQEKTGWVFRTSPHRELGVYRAGSLIALSTRVLLPLQLVACVALLALAVLQGRGHWFALSMPLFSLALGVMVCEICLGALQGIPFSEDKDASEEGLGFGALSTLGLVLALLGALFSLYADGLPGLVLSLALLALASWRLLATRRSQDLPT